jgi:hypothetical protein
LQWLDLLKCLTGSGAAPVLFEFILMKLGPGENEAELPATQVAVDDLEVVDPDLGFAFGMARMEMGEAMIVEEHRDRDPKEAAYGRHEFIMAGATAGRFLGISVRVSFSNPFLATARR